MIGTRYHFGDTYGDIMGRGIIKVRIYPRPTTAARMGNPSS